jgi:predicted acylesterase/phospholipase RssA
MLGCLVEVVGISGGALFALLYVLGYTLEEIERLSIEFDFSILRSINVDSLFTFPIAFGIDSGEALERLIETILRQKGFSATTTFSELGKRCPLGFRCYATEIRTSTVREFSRTKTPSTSVLFALRASMSLPFLYTPVRCPSSTDILMDGGILHNLPIVFMTEEERAHTLGVHFAEDPSIAEGEVDPDITDICRYIYSSVLHMRSMPVTGSIISIPLGNSATAVNFELSADEKRGLIAKGERATEEYLLSTRKTRRVIRRLSAS